MRLVFVNVAVRGCNDFKVEEFMESYGLFNQIPGLDYDFIGAI